MPKLENEQHEAFAQAKADGKSNGEAYRLAGWSGKGSTDRSYGAVINNKPEVAFRVREIQTKRVRARQREPIAIDGIDKPWVLAQAVRCYEIAINAIPVMKNGIQVEGVYRVDLPSAGVFLQKIGLHLGMFEKQVRVTHEKTHVIQGDFEAMVDRIVSLIVPLGPQVAYAIVTKLGFTGDRLPVRSLGSADGGAGDGEATEPLLLSAPSEAS